MNCLKHCDFFFDTILFAVSLKIPFGPKYAIDDMKGVQLEWANPKRYEPSASHDRVRSIANGLSSLLPTGTIAIQFLFKLGA